MSNFTQIVLLRGKIDAIRAYAQAGDIATAVDGLNQIEATLTGIAREESYVIARAPESKRESEQDLREQMVATVLSSRMECQSAESVIAEAQKLVQYVLNGAASQAE